MPAINRALSRGRMAKQTDSDGLNREEDTMKHLLVVLMALAIGVTGAAPA